jgi:cellobiose phosphorylase
MYRLITESLLGLRLDADKLHFAPCLPAAWPTLKIHYRHHDTTYHITVHNGGSGVVVRRVVADGQQQTGLSISLVNDRKDHNVQVDVI